MIRAKQWCLWGLVGLISFTLSCMINVQDPKRTAQHNEAMMNIDPNEPIVYVGPFGTTYHTDECPLLQHRKYSIPLSDAQRFYRPCMTCKPVQ